MKHIITILLLICGTSAYSWGKNNIAEYYKYIYQAEKYLLDVKYPQAASAYDRAFAVNAHPFATDIYNNMLIGVNLKDDVRVFAMAKRLIIKGVTKSYFNQSMFSRFRVTAEWQQLLIIYPMLRKQYLSTVDSALVRNIQAIVDADQIESHKQEDARIALHAKGQYDDPGRKRFQEFEDSLMLQFRTLALNNDYLPEERAGIGNTDSEINFTPFYNVLFTHSFQIYNDTCLLTNVITEAIHKGYMRSAQGMNYFSCAGPFSSAGDKTINYLNDYYMFSRKLYKRANDSTDLNDTKLLRLLSSSPNDREKALAVYCYMDKRERILKKLDYQFHILCKVLHDEQPDPATAFIFGPTVSGVLGDNNRSPKLEKDVEMGSCE